MKKVVLLVFALCLFEFRNAACCFRDPWVLPASSCGCAIPSCGNPCPDPCYTPCKCFKNPANPCDTCDQPSPVCQCLSKCDCGCPNTPIYFPEVQYPVTIMEMSPFYYGSCWSY